jgi:tetratricopeptide (TPR) repeat protein
MLDFLKKVIRSAPPHGAVKQLPSEEELAEFMREGFSFHQSGNQSEAESCYLKILAHRPQDSDALFLLGQIRRSQGKLSEAINLTSQAIAANPAISYFHAQLGTMLLGREEWEPAMASLHKSLELDERSAETHNDLGIALNKLGRKEEAERHFRCALAIAPDLPQAHYNLALKLLDENNLSGAEAHLSRVLEVAPGHVDSLLFLGDICRRGRRYDQAKRHLQAILDVDPLNVKARMGLGACHYEQGDYIQASMLYSEVLQQNLESTQTNYSLGLCYLKREKWVDAESYLQAAINLNAEHWDAYANLGFVFFQQGRLDRAIDLLHSAVDQAPIHPQLYLNYAFALSAKGEFEEAIRIQQAALGFPEHDAEAYSNLAYYYGELDEMDQARDWAEKAVTLRPEYVDGLNNLAHALRSLGKSDEALAVYEKSIGLAPDLPDAHWGKSLALLSLGRFKEGWQEYEWRWRMKNVMPGEKMPGEEWQGEDISDKTLLLYQEQGLGDMIHFVRYAPLLEGHCSQIILAMPRNLKRLFEGVRGVSAVVCEGETPPYDVALPIMSLPRILGTTMQTIPAEVPYLAPIEADVKRWREKFSNGQAGIRVGLVWAGGAAFKGNKQRSMSLPQFAVLGEIPGVNFYSLQKGPSAEEMKNPPAGIQVVDWTDELGDFAETAAFISQLDLVIAVDTAVAHLAGAMGKAVWTLVPASSDFRWLVDREDSPWYPTMRLFRQKERGNWPEVMLRVASELRRLAETAVH